ncbi:hypothetical protein DV737_g5207, partial [Chaetothyriales sp. CBS 132003]
MAHQAAWGDTGQPLDKLEDVPHDPSWVKLLPVGCTVLSATGHGASYWSQSGKIDVQLQDGGNDSFFIKVLSLHTSFSLGLDLTVRKLSRTEIGKTMVKGEYESMKMLHLVSPNSVPKPIGYGTYETNDDIHFFICEFIELYDELPDVVDFCQAIAQLHMQSIDYSPDGNPCIESEGTFVPEKVSHDITMLNLSESYTNQELWFGTTRRDDDDKGGTWF